MPPNPPDSVRHAWTAAALRRFRWMLVLVVGLFLVTETAAHLDVVAALRPLSFHTVATNILLAIGFGSPIVLYLSGLPPPREVLGAVVVSRRGCDRRLSDPGRVECLISSWVTHRHPDAWDDPERFAPERFLGNGRHPFSCLPFGGGPRQCLGSHFAFMEAKVIVAMVATRFTLDLARPSPILLQPGITLRCRGGLAMRLSRAEGLET